MAEVATAANSSRSPAESAPPPWRIANAITSAAPTMDAIQNSGFGRSWVMTTATSAVAIGKNSEHDAAMRGVDGLHRERHQERKQHADA